MSNLFMDGLIAAQSNGGLVDIFDYTDKSLDDVSQDKKSLNETVNEIAIDTLNPESELSFDELVSVLKRTGICVAEYCDQPIVGHSHFNIHVSMGVRYATVSLSLYAPNACGKYAITHDSHTVSEYPGKVKLFSLPVRPLIPGLDDVMVGNLYIRGANFLRLTHEPTFVQAIGFMYVPSNMGGFKRLAVNSRVVVDPSGYQKFASADRWYAKIPFETVPDDLYAHTLPTVPVYSLEYRRWGEVPIDQLTDIVFDKTAFDRTVLRQDYHDMVRQLVTNFYDTRCRDFMESNKAKGLVFLLNGSPGTGKTLTAQGVAELVEAPLYSVSSGDLGTDAAMIDRKLQDIFNMVEKWNGIVLVDEADVFMERRQDHNLEQTACVAVFLRLIEAYSGILFLTTNRTHSIDPAFDSRIHMRLHYENLDDDGRKLVWTEALRRYEITSTISNAQLDELKKYKMNNREIANLVQLAYIRAGGNHERVAYESVEELVRMRQTFTEYLNGVTHV